MSSYGDPQSLSSSGSGKIEKKRKIKHYYFTLWDDLQILKEFSSKQGIVSNPAIIRELALILGLEPQKVLDRSQKILSLSEADMKQILEGEKVPSFNLDLRKLERSLHYLQENSEQEKRD